ncbi:hypothetical protein [Amycolatopsis plumensis]|uniref:hypothetical protein n=1 Tax=Amycolatopsis plumensis TaxID=236508 RepID=UPI00360B6460
MPCRAVPGREAGVADPVGEGGTLRWRTGPGKPVSRTRPAFAWPVVSGKAG